MNAHPVIPALSLAAAFVLAPDLIAQVPASALPPSSVVYNPAAGPAASAVKLTGVQLETLLGPVALYPDALIALILPASASSSDIVLAARYLAANQDPQQLDAQAWDESVRSLARYPDVIKWLDENLAWTQQLGTAFLAQPAEVMQAVQRLRARARDAGTLIDTPQQKVITEGEVILIEPASPTVIYVPRYDPEVVYVSRPYGWTQPSLFFGLGFGVGSWLSYDCDWRTRTIVVGDWRHRPQTVWVRPAFPYRPPAPGVTVVGRPWQPPVHRHSRPTVIVNDPRRPGVIVHPRPYYEHPRRPGSDDPRRPESGPRNRAETRPTNPSVIVNAPPTLSPPSVVMPPAHNIGGPPPGERRRERPTTSLDNPTALPERPRPDVPRGPRGGSSNPDAPREPRPTPNPDRPRFEAPRGYRPESNRRDSGGGERTSRPSAPAPDRSMPDRRAPERVAPPAPPPPAPVAERPSDRRVDEHAR